MIVVDTSAVMAILQGEPEARALTEALEAANVRLISTVSMLEAGILVECRKGEDGARELDAFVSAAELEVVAFDREQAIVARDAFARYGKGRHAAHLNFGDCAIYALAATRAAPLLFKGEDFGATDIQACL